VSRDNVGSVWDIAFPGWKRFLTPFFRIWHERRGTVKITVRFRRERISASQRGGDTLDDQVEKAYAGWPDRIYVIDAKGQIVYKGEPGPRGFKVADVPPVLDKLDKR
jgi:hypothetical protein